MSCYVSRSIPSETINYFSHYYSQSDDPCGIQYLRIICLASEITVNEMDFLEG
jgi:hypothetical protein